MDGIAPAASAAEPADLAAALAPLEQARGLPNACYTDPGHFELEKARVFAANWSCIGFAKDVPDAGDLRPLRFLAMPLLIARDRDGTVRVFHNVCRHRGMILVDQPTRSPAIRCPYHSWCYALDGRLRGTPHAGGPGIHRHPRIARDVTGLFEVRSAVWMDMIFVDLSGRAPDFRSWAAPLIARWREFEGRPLTHGGPDSSFRLALAANWKLAVENYCESYHLPFVHPGLNSYSRLEDHYDIAEAGFSGQGTRVYAPQLDPAGRRFPDFPGLSERWDTAAEYIALYPNVLLGVHRDHVFAIRLDPLGPESCREEVEIYYADPRAADDAWAELRARNSETWKTVFVEDVGVVEGMQQGRHAPAFDGGVFSPAMDGPTHHFHAWVARQLMTGRGRSS